MSFSYFNRLNYTLANEDTQLEMDILPPQASHVMSVAGSGGRTLPLLFGRPKQLTCVDLAQEQLFLNEMRFAAVRQLDYDGFCGLLGFIPMKPEDRRKIFQSLALSAAARDYLRAYFDNHHWQSLLYQGKWEQTFIKLSRINRRITGPKGWGIFACGTLDEQREYYHTIFPQSRWAIVVMLLGNAPVFNSLLYKGHFPNKNIPFSFYRYYKKAFDRIFTTTLLRENFFMQLLFFGKIEYPGGVPVEAHPEYFPLFKKNVMDCEIHYTQENIVDLLSHDQNPVDFLSFSDVPSYFSDHLGQTFLQQIKPGLMPEAKVVIRNYLHVPWRTDTRGYEAVTYNYESSIEREKTQMYLVDIYKRLPLC